MMDEFVGVACIGARRRDAMWSDRTVLHLVKGSVQASGATPKLVLKSTIERCLHNARVIRSMLAAAE